MFHLFANGYSRANQLQYIPNAFEIHFNYANKQSHTLLQPARLSVEGYGDLFEM